MKYLFLLLVLLFLGCDDSIFVDPLDGHALCNQTTSTLYRVRNVGMVNGNRAYAIEPLKGMSCGTVGILDSIE